MILGLLMGCNNRIAELEKKNQFLGAVVNLGNEFLNVFTSFGEMAGGVLGFNATTKKSEVGDYFKKVHDTVQGTQDKLNTMIENMKTENNPNAIGVETAVTKLVSEKLDKIIDGAKTVSDAIGTEVAELIGNVADSGGGAGKDIENIVKGIKSIVDVVLKDKGSAEAGDLLNPADDSNGTNDSARTDTDDNANNGALALFANKAINTAGAEKAAKDSAKAVSAVTGADILKAISEGISGNAAKLAINNGALSSNTPIAAAKATDVTIAGGIALRAMAKEGKCANKDGAASAAKNRYKVQPLVQ